MRTTALVLSTAVLLTACSTPDPGPVFDTEGAADITCLKHQPTPPGPRYSDDTLRRTDETLPLLRYYTAHGRKPFCDGQPPTGTDQQWARTYVQLGADRANVAGLID
ncbi:hypothetical protein ABZ816_37350 [Actinosynnema sp. NPDC047251]|uniref:Putative secreted protein n=1 Tax=Saccharothrix espanaensis (strain ATCC 51144 / DSM 44229 / JCM 9112 / NBRC 15066 / NRRL 15764) TaxID=1179773 RepID=K0K535_SACES|nr:hypothetical protein [Saccharothrix espanaensis]CCH32697.1 putative secreted protein [Saccharothrix espanaensis DSM 44229]